MKKLALLGILAVVACSVAFFTQARASNTNEPSMAGSRLEEREDFACSNETLKGTYGLSISGTRPAPPSPGAMYVPGTIEQLIGVGTRTFDGDGNFSQVTNEKGSLSGILFPNRTLQGTYSLNADCTGTLTLHIPGLPFSVLYDIVAVNHGRAFDSIVTTPQPVMISTTGRKLD